MGLRWPGSHAITNTSTSTVLKTSVRTYAVVSIAIDSPSASAVTSISPSARSSTVRGWARGARVSMPNSGTNASGGQCVMSARAGGEPLIVSHSTRSLARALDDAERDAHLACAERAPRVHREALARGLFVVAAERGDLLVQLAV